MAKHTKLYKGGRKRNNMIDLMTLGIIAVGLSLLISVFRGKKNTTLTLTIILLLLLFIKAVLK